jgi:hypothetical protein
MDLTARLGPNRPDVISDLVDGEAMLINASNGYYYVLNPVGTLIWSMIEAQSTTDAIISRMKEIYPEESGKIGILVAEFLRNLQQDHLIGPRLPRPDGESDSAFPVENLHPPFAKPEIEKFTDMSELIRMDPIHDVSERGWPKRQRAK